jgi:2-oxoglutarate ferredoxin oxidoreductase subunit beta
MVISKKQNPLLKYLRQEALPTTFCPGCGCGTILNAYVNALDNLRIPPEKTISVTGIGCSSWITSPHFKGDTLHTTHGRAVAFATGVKVMKPDMHVVVIAGDGDLAGIGINHLIHAARRNIGLTVLLVNNNIYGMTGGQFSATTPKGLITNSSPYKNIENPFNIADIITASGANYVARWTTYQIFPLIHSIEEALKTKGFSFIEIISQCPMNYGRSLGIRTGGKFLEYFKKNSISIEKAQSLSENEKHGKFIVGKLVQRNSPEFTEQLKNINKKLQDES